MRYIIVTNNNKCWEKYSGTCQVEYQPQWTYLEVLIRARDLIHTGVQLITHPMAGSLKPNQTPYRSVVLGTQSMEDKEPWQDVGLIESSIASCEKFLRCRALPTWTERSLSDFKTLDLSFVEGALSSDRFRGSLGGS